MRPREREEDPSTPEPALAPDPSPAPRIGPNLSSMVVCPSESDAGSDREVADANHRRRVTSPDPRRRESSPPLHRSGSSPHFRRRLSPPPFRRRGSPPPARLRGSPPAVHRRDSPPAFPRRYFSPAFQPRSQRLKDEPVSKLPAWLRDHWCCAVTVSNFIDIVQGYGLRGISNSSPPRRQRLDDSRYDADFDHSVGSHLGRGFRGRGDIGRLRESSPHHGRGRGAGRSFGRAYDAPGRRLSPDDSDYGHRNDPNLSPREGDWICRNPSCGNLNFARRAYCNNCNQHRFGPELSRSSRSPQRAYFNSPPPYESPPRNSGPPMDRGRREINRYGSPRFLGPDDLRDFGSVSPPPRHRRDRSPYHTRRVSPAYPEDGGYRGRGKFHWPEHEWDHGDHQRDVTVRSRRGGFGQRPRSPSPRDRWIRDSRGRSRSPFGDRPQDSGSYRGRGRTGGRHSNSYAGRGRGDDLDAGRGRDFRNGDESFVGKGRGDRPGPGISRGRASGIY